MGLQARELRIGNIVGGYTPLIKTIQYCKISGVYYDTEYHEYKILVPALTEHPLTEIGIAPIPLTEEWLVRFGFEKCTDAYYINNVGNIFKGENGYWIDDNESGTINNIPLLHVHQLQNLYFALTGEELTYV